MLSAFNADVLECEDMRALKQGTNILSPCHDCFLSRNENSSSKATTKRILKDSLELLGNIKSGSWSGEEKLQIKSVLPIPAILFVFPFVSIHNSVNTYSIFRFELTHALSLGTPKLLKECLRGCLTDQSRSSTAMQYLSCQPKPFHIIWMKCLPLLNNFLKETRRDGLRLGFRLDLSKEKLETYWLDSSLKMVFSACLRRKTITM